MPQNVFKISDGRTHFCQWDMKQKLIVLDDRITHVRFSNRDMEHSKRCTVYTDGEQRVCNVPDVLLQLPKNLVAHACIEDESGSSSTVKSVKFAVVKQPIPADYVCEQTGDIEEKLAQIDVKLDAVSASKADDIYYDEDGKYIQLTANGELIGSRVQIPESGASGIENCEINEEGHLIVTLVGGKIIDAGYVGSESGATFVPHISADKILTWTCDKDLPVPDPVDLNVFDEWEELGDDGEQPSQYNWEFM